jgi:hypothetical protein
MLGLKQINYLTIIGLSFFLPRGQRKFKKIEFCLLLLLSDAYERGTVPCDDFSEPILLVFTGNYLLITKSRLKLFPLPLVIVPARQAT